MPLTDHHELAGFENPNRMLQTWLETEFRPQFYTNLLNRLLLLEFVEAKPDNGVREQIGVRTTSPAQVMESKQVKEAKGVLSDAFSIADRKT